MAQQVKMAAAWLDDLSKDGRCWLGDLSKDGRYLARRLSSTSGRDTHGEGENKL